MITEELMPNRTEAKSIKTADGTKMYYFNNKLHNYDGAAVIPTKESGKKPQYFIYGKEFSKKDYDKMLKDRNGVPFCKTAAGKASLRGK
jgi:hypothetical protein